MKLYIAGPMTGYPGHNFPLFNMVAMQLRKRGFEVINPADTGIIPDWNWEDYMKLDIRFVTEVDGIALLPDWQASPGADFEVSVAHKLRIPCLPWDLWLLDNHTAIKEVV